LQPKTDKEVLKRYLFAITSVHTTWEGNVRGYNAIKDLGWVNDKENLRQRLIDSRCGMHNVRTESIWNFKKQFFQNIKQYSSIPENWQAHRNSLVKAISGLGMAKVSFTLEMLFPIDALVTCVDTHGIQLYEIPAPSFQTKKQVEICEQAENHWVKRSLEKNCSPYVARCIYWDALQKKSDSRYWSYVLEN